MLGETPSLTLLALGIQDSLEGSGMAVLWTALAPPVRGAASPRSFARLRAVLADGPALTLLASAQQGGTQKKGPSMRDPFSVFGSACWARTSDPLINSQLLYQLS